ncbi:MAG: tRNA (adenosine(37)-N6)-threonylcarbamoyltransferase complex ATPase subunit type 1 TsaE [Acidimicrobiia bacterium]|nr:tRNA (adenosine(37)-N6)-threonylcarbamoyltransferase complex ATPase subunit type 1 TsaE [Acidimicrobiia bacterium]
MSGRSVVTHSAAETRTVGRTVGAVLEAGDVVLLAGELGAGKTQLAKGIADGLGVTEPVVSPTFTIAREYEGRVRMVHVDVYRLDRAQEVLDLGLDDAGDDVVTVVEWGDVAGAYLPAERLEIRLEIRRENLPENRPENLDGVAGAPDDRSDDRSDDRPDDRVVTITATGPAWQARGDALASVLGSALGAGRGEVS